MFNSVIFREYDIRGVYDVDYDLDFVYQLGLAFCFFVREKYPHQKLKLSLGYDARQSSLAINETLTKAFVTCGVEVYQLGLITSPLSYFSTFHIEGLLGGIMITGSHNPPEYNGFKLSVGQTTIFGNDILALKDIIDSQKTIVSPTPGSVIQYQIFDPYVLKYSNEFSGLGKIKVVLDCGNGAAGVIARRLYESVGLKPIILYEKPDGSFPNHHPDPTVEKNMESLKLAVLEHQADVGIGFDGDADRIGIVDNTGRFILGDELILLLSRQVLSQLPGSKIIGDVKCSDRLYKDIALKGGQPIMWKTGHSLIKEKIKVEKAPFGGEMSGHVFFADRNYGYDDALYAGLRVCEIIAQSKCSVAQLLSDLTPAFNTPEIRIDTTEAKKQSIVTTLINRYKNPPQGVTVNLLDGIRLSYEDGWALARASNTQPVLVLRFESSSPDGLARIEKEIRSIVDPLL